MKLQKILIAGLITCSMAFGVSAFAQGGKHHGKRARWAQMSEQEKLEFMDQRLDKRMARLDKELDLTDAQEKQVRQIFETTRTQLMDIRERNKGDRAAGRKEARQVFKQSKAELKKVLTAEQQQKFKAMRKKHRGKRMHRMFERLDRALDLDDKQEKQVLAIMKDTRKQMRAAAKSTDDRQARRKAIRAALEQGGDRIEQVLDADQKAKFQKIRQRMKKRHGHRGHHGAMAPDAE